MALPERLAKANIPPHVLDVVARLREKGHATFLVGGCVRDILLGTAPKDFDVATAAHPPQVQAAFPKVIPTGIQHGTVTVLARGQPVEVTTFRTESEYLDGRRPSKVEFHSEIEADLSRRDFTINAMAFDPIGGELVDPFGGQHDLAVRRVRCVRDAFERFSEDGLRPLRAVRIATVLEFELEPDTEAAIPRTLQVFAKVAGERVQQELAKLLLARAPGRGLRWLASTGLLGVFLAELLPFDPARAEAVDRAPRDVALRLAALLQGKGGLRDLLIRLKFPTKVVEEVALIVEQPPPADPTDPELRRWMAKVGRGEVERALEVAIACGLPNADRVAARARAQLAENPPLAAKDLALQGREIMVALGIGPSPRVGEATRFLIDRVLENPALNTPSALTDQLRKWAKNLGL
jgi:tRNA nucleotidyltransferase (CCA-adding enzyme)